jgi:hypothetical protein
MMVIRWPKHVRKWLLNILYILVTDTEQVLCWNSAFVGTIEGSEWKYKVKQWNVHVMF